MKKIAPIAIMAIMALAFTSCKKDYTCTCVIGTQTVPYKYNKVKKDDAKKSCDQLNASAAIAGGSCSL